MAGLRLLLLVQAMWLKKQTGSGLAKWRLHTHFEVDRFVPLRIDVTPNGGGEHGERAVLERTLEADLCFRSENGIKLQAYCAIIACMLICLWTGRIAFPAVEFPGIVKP